MTPQPLENVQPETRWPWGKIVLLGCGAVVLLGLGVIVAVYYGLKHMTRSSAPYQTAVISLRQSAAAAKALGEIKDVGLPSGSFQSQSKSASDFKLNSIARFRRFKLARAHQSRT